MRSIGEPRQLARALSLGALLMTGGAKPALAWGRTGHRLTALVAERYLTPAARAEVKALLHSASLVDVASWADDYRNDHPETAPWHYVDIPGPARAFDRERDCPVSASDKAAPWRDCVTDRIVFFEERLANASLGTGERAQALKFLVHLVGDVHQPFHAWADAHGGNKTRVSVLGSSQCGGAPCNLHGVWDDTLIERQGLSDQRYTARLLEEIRDNKWERYAGGSPAGWANQSHGYAVLAAAPDGALLMSDYIQEETRVVDAQLAIGGLRLAAVLNRILAAKPAAEQDRLPTPAETHSPPG